MKLVKFFCWIGLLFCSQFSLNAQTTAVEYLEKLSQNSEEITKDSWNYIRLATRGRSARRVNNKRKELLSTLKQAQKEAFRAGSFEGSTLLRDAYIQYLKVYHATIDHDYGKIMDLEEIAERSYDAMEAYILAQEVAEEKLHEASSTLNQEIEVFANSNQINLIENTSRRGKKLLQASKAMSYYNDVFLIFFKAHHQESYFMQAVQAGDVNALEQSRAALASFAQEGLDRMDTIGRYENDLSLKIACIEALNFYLTESGQQSDGLASFFMAKAEFDKAKAAMDNTPRRNRTQEMVDTYNESVNTYNEAINNFNQTMEQFNKRRSRVLETWNKTGDKFRNKHIPR